ncbi:hypothetical protein [Halalkalibacterium halodurans]|uniref:Uncharacterized protein n=1 Tax=Halalkalibacterium halodurans TaxID=86665 RepID=A0A0M0KF97_ALKHA|nr:hypothetical protein [Halalkalibacterium halodurans]MED4163257.1 hypothetical protein [Halalkalibacterium halodurans]TES56490.1 hypothetical protein E2L07_04650 [Halalkalibacterium halodurans]TPE69233.1 hypothetical protein AMD02_009390 [Halalkalibacterium halodurans]
MKHKGKIVFALFLVTVIVIIGATQKTPAEKMSARFSEYVKENQLDVLRQTTPQPLEPSLLALYVTPDDQMGIAEFGEETQASAEARIDGDYTIVTLEGNDGQYVGILVSKEFRQLVAAVSYYDKQHQKLGESLFLEDEFIVLDRLENDVTAVYSLEFTDQNGKVVTVVESP